MCACVFCFLLLVFFLLLHIPMPQSLFSVCHPKFCWQCDTIEFYSLTNCHQSNELNGSNNYDDINNLIITHIGYWITRNCVTYIFHLIRTNTKTGNLLFYGNLGCCADKFGSKCLSTGIVWYTYSNTNSFNTLNPVLLCVNDERIAKNKQHSSNEHEQNDTILYQVSGDWVKPPR